MAEELTPTDIDRARDLAADLHFCESYLLLVGSFATASFEGRAAASWPAAIRRALWAEAELARLRPPGLAYKCGCPAVPSDKVKAFCPAHHEPLKQEAGHA